MIIFITIQLAFPTREAIPLEYEWEILKIKTTNQWFNYILLFFDTTNQY